MTSTVNDVAPAKRGRRGGKARSTAGPVGVRGAGASNRQRQLPWVAMGLLLLVMSMLGFALWSSSQAARTPVLVAARSIDPGQTIERADLKLVSVGADAGLDLLQAGQEELVIGSTARGPIPEGTPLSTALVVSASEAVPVGFAVVGADLGPGGYPTSALEAGDRVVMVQTADPSPTVEEEVVNLGPATVWAVVPLVERSGERLFVSLLVPEEQAAAVADVAAAEQLRLVLVRGEP